MDVDYERRAAARRASWRGGVARSFEELEARGLQFWQEASPAARLDAMWQLIVEAWELKGKHGPPPGLQGSVVGVGRFER
jgi:hypothetical protein